MATTAQIAQNVGLREKILARGKTQQQVAKEGKMSPWTINLACKGEMTMETRTKIASVLGLSPEEIGAITKSSRWANSKKRSAEIEARPTSELAKKKPAQTAGTIFVKDMGTERETVEIPAEFEGEDGDILAAALFRTRKSKGFSAAEVEVLKDWAESIVAQAKQLRNLLIGNLTEVNVINGQAVIGQTVVGKTAEHAKPSAIAIGAVRTIEVLIKEYLDEGAKAWGKPYHKEKSYLIPAMAEKLSLDIIEDLTAKRFDASIKKQGKTLAVATITKNVKHFGQFVAWAVEKGYLSENPLQNEDEDHLSAAHIRSLT